MAHVRSAVLVIVAVLAAGAVIAQPSVDISKSPDEQTVDAGGDATFDIFVENDGDAALSDVVVTDAETPDCDATIGDLAIGASVSYQCTASNVVEDFVNTACVAAVSGSFDCFCPRTPGYWKNHQNDWPVQELQLGSVVYGADDLKFFLKHGDRAADASFKLARHLTAVKFNLLSGSDPSIEGVVADADAFLTLYPPGSDPQGADRDLAIAIKDQLDAYNNAVDCEEDIIQCGGVEVSDCDEAAVIVASAVASIDIAKNGEGPGTVMDVFFGDTNIWTISVTNNGDVPLTGVSVDDPVDADCNRPMLGGDGNLDVDETITYTCGVANVVSDFIDNTAFATGFGAGTTVEDSDPATVFVIDR